MSIPAVQGTGYNPYINQAALAGQAAQSGANIQNQQRTSQPTDSTNAGSQNVNGGENFYTKLAEPGYGISGINFAEPYNKGRQAIAQQLDSKFGSLVGNGLAPGSNSTGVHGGTGAGSNVCYVA